MEIETKAKITEVTICKTIPTGNFSNIRISLTASTGEKSADAVSLALNKKINEIFVKIQEENL